MSSPTQDYRHDIQGLRAFAIIAVIAVIAVIAAHARLPGSESGFMGVDVFFVISGYLITSLLLKEWASKGHVDLLNFYAARLRRLAPALLTMVFVCTISTYFLISPIDQREHLTAAAAASFWVSNLHFAFQGIEYFDLDTDPNAFLHTWSLGVEEQFYLFWPPLLLATLLLCAKAREKSKTKLALGVAALLLSIVSLFWVFLDDSVQRNYFLPFPRAWQFAAGALTLLLGHRIGTSRSFPALVNPIRGRKTGALFVYSGLIVLSTGLIFFDADRPYPGWWAIFPTLGTCLLLAGGNTQSIVKSTLSSRPARFIGAISYSWYLWHWPILVFTSVIDPSNSMTSRIAAIAISFCAAVLSLYVIENPTRHGRLRSVSPKTTLVVMTVTMLGISALPVLLAGQNYNLLLTSDRLSKIYAARNDAPDIYHRGCDDWIDSDTVKKCSEAEAEGGTKVYLVGDSLAGQWHSALAAVPDWHLTTITKSACPMVDEPIFYSRIGAVYDVCEQWKKGVIEAVKTDRPNIIIWGSSYNYRYTKSQWIDGTIRLVSEVKDFVDEIIIIEPTPRWESDPLSCVANQIWQEKMLPFNLPIDCAASFDQAAIAPVTEYLQSVAAQFPKVRTVSFNHIICPNQKCVSYTNSTIVFRDKIHVTDSFAAKMQTQVAEAIRNTEP